MTILRLIALLGLGLLLGCGTVGNVKSWFGGGEQKVKLIPRGGFPQDNDTRPLIGEILGVSVEPVIGGGIVTATGLAPVQGYWDAELVSDTLLQPEDGVLTLYFRVRPPPAPTGVSTQQSREITVSIFVPRQKLDNSREIKVLGAGNTRSVRH